MDNDDTLSTGRSMRHWIECRRLNCVHHLLLGWVAYVDQLRSRHLCRFLQADPGSLLCQASTGTITPSTGWNSIAISGCPTLSANTAYWAGYITGSNQIDQGTVGGTCPGLSYYNVWSNNTLSSVALANPFGASSQEANGRCYSLYMTLTTGSLPTPTLSVSSSLNPTGHGQPVSFTATISSGPSGLVTFYSDGAQIGQAPIAGTTATHSRRQAFP